MQLSTDAHACVYCLTEMRRKDITEDHVFARSWYPTTTPDNTAKWKVPSCRRCNNKYSAIEDDLRVRFALTIDPDHPASKGIYESALRAIDPGSAKNLRDKDHRAARRKRLLEALGIVDGLAGKGILPFSERNYDLGSRLAIPVPADKLHALVRKWVRGVHYYCCERLISGATNIDVFHVNDDVAHTAFGPLKELSTVLESGPLVRVDKFSGHGDGILGHIYGFTIWDQYKVFASFDELGDI